MSHEILLTAVLADRDDRFDERGLRSWIETPPVATVKSRKSCAK